MFYIFNLPGNCLVNEFGSRITAKPQIAFSTAPTWTIQLSETADGMVVPLDLSDAMSWRAAIDCDHDTRTNPMCRTLSDGIDHSKAAQGQITIRLNANTETFHAAVNGKASRDVWFELWGLDAAGDAVYYCKIPILATMPIDPFSGEQPPGPTEQWADQIWVEARLRAGYELQYSDMSDPSDWSDSPNNALWYRFRNREVGGLWSDPIRLLPGEKGDSPYIGSNNNWFIGGLDTGIPATGPVGPVGGVGPVGPEGDTPEIGPNGNWFVRGIDTGICATGPQGPGGTGPAGQAGQDAPLPQYQYSVDGATWSDTYTDGDVYCRISTDGGVSWTPAIRIKGEDGGIVPVEFNGDNVTGGVATLAGEYPVVMLKTNTGSLYHLEDGDTSWSDGSTRIDLSRYLMYENAVEFSGIWSAYFAAGLNGKDAIGKDGANGLNLRVHEAYEPERIYARTEEYADAVPDQGCLWMYINAEPSSGNAPPEYPVEQNDYWKLAVRKGNDGVDGTPWQVVETLPENPAVDTLYFILE